MRPRIFFLPLVLASIFAPRGQAQETDPYELPPIKYSATQPHDVVTRLQAELVSGQLNLKGQDRQVVEALLHALHISSSSQMLVFSKTSFQSDRIGPAHPRALYYTDDCYVGWVPGGLVEIAAIDPQLGPVFYSFDPRGLSEKNRPEFSRESACLRCHGGHFIRDIPAVLARSLFADNEGQPIYRQGTELVDYRTPFSERWGGWYVTGLNGSTLHRGNVYASELRDQLVFNPALGANITNLSSFFDASDYLTNSSDIVALLIFEHQIATQNALTHAGQSCRRMLDYQKGLQEALHETADADGLCFDSVRTVFDQSAEEVVDALLSKNEATLPKVITGSAAFQKAFSAAAPHDRDGGSLKDLLLSEHLFKNRCSYLIYSDSLLALPQPLKHRIYARLSTALNPEQPDLRYNYIGGAERRRIGKILRETHPEFSPNSSQGE